MFKSGHDSAKTTWRELCYALAYTLDDSGSLVTEYDREEPLWVQTIQCIGIRVTKSIEEYLSSPKVVMSPKLVENGK